MSNVAWLCIVLIQIFATFIVSNSAFAQALPVQDPTLEADPRKPVVLPRPSRIKNLSALQSADKNESPRLYESPGPFDAAHFYKWVDTHIPDRAPPDFADQPVDYGLGLEELEWATHISDHRPDLSLSDVATWIKETRFQWTGSAQELQLGPGQQLVEAHLPTGDRIEFRIGDDVAERVGWIGLRVRGCETKEPEKLPESWSSRPSCFVVESTLGHDFEALVDITVFPAEEIAPDIASQYFISGEMPGKGFDGDDRVLTQRYALDTGFHAADERPFRGVTAKSNFGQVIDVYTRPSRAAGQVIGTGTVYRVSWGFTNSTNCLNVWSDGSIAPNTKVAPSIENPPTRTDKIPVFKVCGLKTLKDYVASQPNQSNKPPITNLQIAKRFAEIWTGLTKKILRFPYAKSGWEQHFRTIQVEIERYPTDTGCGTTVMNGVFSKYAPGETIFRPKITVKPIIYLHLYAAKKKPQVGREHFECYPVDGNKVDYTQMFAHEVVHALLYFNRAYWVDAEYGLGNYSQYNLHRMLELPQWLEEMLATWATEQLHDKRPYFANSGRKAKVFPKTAYGYQSLIDGSSSMQGRQHPLDRRVLVATRAQTDGYNLPVFLNFLIENSGGTHNPRPAGGNITTALLTLLDSGLRNMHPSCLDATRTRKPTKVVDHYCDPFHASAYDTMRRLTKLKLADLYVRFAEQLLTCKIEADLDMTPDLFGVTEQELKVLAKNKNKARYLSDNFECERLVAGAPWLMSALREDAKTTKPMGSTITLLPRKTAQPDWRLAKIKHPITRTKLHNHKTKSALKEYDATITLTRPAHIEEVIDFPISLSGTKVFDAAKPYEDCSKVGGSSAFSPGPGSFLCGGSTSKVYTQLTGDEDKLYSIMEQPAGSLFAYLFKFTDARGADIARLKKKAQKDKVTRHYFLEFNLWCMPYEFQKYKVNSVYTNRECENIDLLIIKQSASGQLRKERVNLHRYVSRRQTTASRNPTAIKYRVDLGSEEEALETANVFVVFINHDKIEKRDNLWQYPLDKDAWGVPVTHYGLALRLGLKERANCAEHEVEAPDGRCVCSAEVFRGDPRALKMAKWQTSHGFDKEGAPVCRMVPPCEINEYWASDEKGVGRCAICGGDAKRSFRKYYGDGKFLSQFECVDCKNSAWRSNSLVPIWMDKQGRRYAKSADVIEAGEELFASCGCPNDISELGPADNLLTYKQALELRSCEFPCATWTLNNKRGNRPERTRPHYWNLSKQSCDLANAKKSLAQSCCVPCTPTFGQPPYDEVEPVHRSMSISLSADKDSYAGCRDCYSDGFRQDLFVRFAKKNVGTVLLDKCMSPVTKSPSWYANMYFTRKKTSPNYTLLECPAGSKRDQVDETSCDCNGTKLTSPSTQYCQKSCADIMSWNVARQKCECPPDLPVWNGTVGKCEGKTCSGGRNWDRSSRSCKCPPDLPVFSAGKCQGRSCSAGRDWDRRTRSCKCPPNKTWNGSSCGPRMTWMGRIQCPQNSRQTGPWGSPPSVACCPWGWEAVTDNGPISHCCPIGVGDNREQCTPVVYTNLCPSGAFLSNGPQGWGCYVRR